MPSHAIQDLLAAVPEGAGETITIQPEVSLGQEVQVVEGAFAGLRAVVTRMMPARQRVAVLLEFWVVCRKQRFRSEACCRRRDIRWRGCLKVHGGRGAGRK